MMWLRVLEAWLVARLLASPTFHRGVRRVHKRVHEIRHGKDPSEMGGTAIDAGKFDGKKFLTAYKEELKQQFWGAKNK